jgi:POT family proton-dependent oligopeptide transporter
LAEKVGWHFGFGAAAVGMALGLIYFRMTSLNLKGAGELPAAPLSSTGKRNGKIGIGLFTLGLAVVTVLMLSGTLSVDPIRLSKVTAVVFLIIFAIYFGSIYFGGNLNKVEKKGMLALLLICIASTMFWSGFEQAGTSFNLFTRDFVDRNIFGWEMPTSWFQSINSWFIVLLSPFFAYFWLWLGRRLITPAYGIKCGIGLIIMGLGFVVMVFAAKAASGGNVTVFWLLLVYFLHTVGELFLSPIALSAVSKLAPPRYLSQMMGVFVLTYSIGNIIAGILAGGFDAENVAVMPNLFQMVATFAIGVGAVVILVGMFTKGWEKEVEDANANAEVSGA